MEEPSSSSTPSAPKAPKAATTNDGQDLSELLRSMTTTTTIERFDDPKDDKATASASLSPDATNQSDNGGSYHPHASSVPTSISRSYKVFGIPTHAFCQIFSDRFVVGVTQLQTKSSGNETKSSGHIGSWVYCQASKSQIDPRQVDFEISTLLGAGGANSTLGSKDEKEIYARRITERLLEKKSIPGGTDRIVLLLGISLLPIKQSSGFSSIERFKVLVEVLVEIVEEALRIALA